MGGAREISPKRLISIVLFSTATFDAMAQQLLLPLHPTLRQSLERSDRSDRVSEFS
jgi:hypothetical protein